MGYGNDWPPGGMQSIAADMVHPILRAFVGFRLEDHATKQIYWESHNEFPELWRPLIFATHLLSNTYTLAFFHKILFDEPQLLEAETRFYGRSVYHFPTNSRTDTEGLTEDERIRTTETLCALAKHICIQFALPSQPPFTRTTTPTVWATTHRSTNTRNAPEPVQLSSTSRAPREDELHQNGTSSIYTASLGFRGTNARILLNPAFKRFLERDARPPGSRRGFVTPPFYERQHAMFFLAITLVREIAHAVWLCRMPADTMWQEQDGGYEMKVYLEDWEPFVGRQRRADLGRAWERSVFGGTVEVCAGELMRQRRQRIGPPEMDARGDLFAMGLGLKDWPDSEEKMVGGATYYPGLQVPLARVLDEGDMMEVADDNHNNKNKTTNPRARLPVVQSADRWETLRVLPFWFVAQFFQAAMWTWAHGPASHGGESSTLRRWIEMEALRWPRAVRENPRWGVFMGRGARPADLDGELELIRREVEAGSGVMTP